VATTSVAKEATDVRGRNVEAVLDAAERLLVEVGYGRITTRRLATEADLNQGLIHYYFGSMDEVLVQVLERFTERLIARQRQMYTQDVPFLEKWRTAMGYLEQDLDAGYPKVWCELQAMAWSRPELQKRIARVFDEWRDVLTDAFSAAVDEYGLDRRRYPVAAVVALVMTFNEGIFLERLSGFERGHRELMTWVEAWLSSLDKERRG
jgi:AcrR family transcriptional regulator